MAIGTASFIHDSVILLRNLLASGITDPVSASRSGTDSRFIMTSFPQHSVLYPLITIKQLGMVDIERMGMSTEQKRLYARYEVDVWSKSTKQRDEIAGSVYNVLRTNQLGIENNISGTVVEGLYNFQLINMFDRVEGEKEREKIHRKVLEFSYVYITV